jgi:hypothetical protein
MCLIASGAFIGQFRQKYAPLAASRPPLPGLKV